MEYELDGVKVDKFAMNGQYIHFICIYMFYIPFFLFFHLFVNGDIINVDIGVPNVHCFPSGIYYSYYCHFAQIHLYDHIDAAGIIIVASIGHILKYVYFTCRSRSL